MKTGQINKLILSLGIVALAVLAVKLFLIERKTTLEQEPGAILKNSSQFSAIPDFQAIADVAEKKQAFFDYLRPAIRHHNAVISDQRKFLQQSRTHLLNQQPLSEAEDYRILQLASKYQYSMRSATLESLDELLKRVDTIPEDLVLIQAANETGWGSSRFAREGMNFFGQWCFKKGCGLVPQSRTEGLSHEVAVFKSVEDSVGSYMRNLNSNAAYSLLRAIRADLRAQNQPVSAEKLVYGLMNYSERQEAYVEELLDMLRHNNQFLVENHEQSPAV
ncbi:glucosaminidase domain-containing protein [Shewanella insulae]|uniref:glucosaminidase domain-containing protein n=1 Tax=Shewanella insulae TaxID=2681496 RepID=UPI001EFE470D|nr:glucosaminidase domain-containing protein [Shewanella insulae]MCG9736677.1 glucosaminidase domain-containing protein [Shewanella insulae]